VPLTVAVRQLVETEELKPKVRQTLRDLIAQFDRWAGLFATTRHSEVAETILEESGYTDMWKKDRSAEAAGRLENLKELIRSMEEFEHLQGFLEHVSLVMEAATGETDDRVTVMTLHAAKGLEFDTVFLPGWEESLFPHPRALDDQGKAGLEEERRLAYVGLTRARRNAHVMFASNRRIHGSWNATIPSRFVDELPETDVEVREGGGPSFAPGSGGYGHGQGSSRFDRMTPFSGSAYQTPGWQRAQQQGGGGFAGRMPQPERGGRQIEGELIAKSSAPKGRFDVGARVFHIKFGPGAVAAVDGNKLTVDFDKAGRKMVLEGYVEAA
jgi:DNA helicase-2/ATP-dependent DNA helicase PcrA